MQSALVMGSRCGACVFAQNRDMMSLQMILSQAHACPWSPACACGRLLVWVGAPVAAATGVLALWGPWAFVLAIAQALVGILLLEVVNYVEHYGLVRARLNSGRCATSLSSTLSHADMVIRAIFISMCFILQHCGDFVR